MNLQFIKHTTQSHTSKKEKLIDFVFFTHNFKSLLIIQQYFEKIIQDIKENYLKKEQFSFLYA